MQLKALALQNFRTFSHWSYHFIAPITIILGNNATGKTSILEAISLLATGDSFRAQKIDEVVALDQEYGRIKGKIQNSDDEDIVVEVIVNRGIVQGKRTNKRLFLVNNVKRLKKNSVGKIMVVIFRPEDMRLIEGSKSRRRSFLDGPLSMVFPNYSPALKEYEQILKRRNKLLLSVREGEQPRSVLHYWNQSLIYHAEIIYSHRKQLLQFFNTVSFSIPFTVQYEPSLLTEKRQVDYLDREIQSGKTLIGPHKDEFIVSAPVTNLSESVPVATYGSRGQQRLAVLWLKYAELQFLQMQSQEIPLLLLDDIMSELDEKSEEFVLSIMNNYQTIITTTEPVVVERITEKVKEKIEIVQTVESRKVL